METKTVNQLNKERIQAANMEKAQNYEAERDAAREQAKYLFLVNHTGHKAQANGAYYSCEANSKVLEEYMAQHNLGGTDVSHFEEAFRETQTQLAQPEAEEYVRKTDRKEKLFPDQVKHTNLPKPDALPYTREQLLEISRSNLSKFKQLMHRNLEGVNKILRGEN